MQGKAVLLAAAVVAMLAVSPASSLGAPDGYEVVEGDTLSEIADRYGLSAWELAEANGIEDPDLILAGQVLLVPGPAEGDVGGAGRTADTSGDIYIVRLGDTLSEIAERFGAPVAALVEANGLTDPHLIVEGQALTIPGVGSPLERPVSPEVEALLDEFAAAEGLDPGLVKALAYKESGWQQGAVSRTGAVGVMQIQPSTGYWLETEVFGYDLNIETSIYDNVRAGVRYLRILRDLSGDIDRALAAYYQGYASLSLGILFEDTVQYLAGVKALRDRFWP